MRRKDKALKHDDLVRLLQGCEYGTLATVDEQGQPYSVPLNYLFQHDSIYFHCALQGHKLNNISANNKVSFSVVGRTRLLPAEFSTEYESVIVFGEASVVEGEERYAALRGLVKKYAAEFVEEGHEYIEKFDSRTTVVKITVGSLTGKAQQPEEGRRL